MIAIRMHSNHNKYLVVSCLLASIIIANYFQSDLLALEVSTPEFKLNSMQSLLDRNDMNVIVINNSNYVTIINQVYQLYNIVDLCLPNTLIVSL